MGTTEFPITIGQADKNKSEVIIVSINQFKGKRFIDARVNFRDNDDPNKLIPTKKGITLSNKTFEPVMKLFLEAYTQFKALEDEMPDAPKPRGKKADENEVPEP